MSQGSQFPGSAFRRNTGRRSSRSWQDNTSFLFADCTVNISLLSLFSLRGQGARHSVTVLSSVLAESIQEFLGRRVCRIRALGPPELGRMITSPAGTSGIFKDSMQHFVIDEKRQHRLGTSGESSTGLTVIVWCRRS